VRAAVDLLTEREALAPTTAASAGTVAPHRQGAAPAVVIAEPDRAHMTRELIGTAASLTGNVTVVSLDPPDAPTLSSWGADAVVHLRGDNVEEDVARTIGQLLDASDPAIVLAGSTAWGREIAARVAAHTISGLTGDAMELEVDALNRLVAWKPAFGGQLVAAVRTTSPHQIATVRAGVLPTLVPRTSGEIRVTETPVVSRSRVRVLARTRDDDLDVLAEAEVVIGVGQGVPPDAYDELEPLRALLGAELGATRKVTDKGWLPRSRQVGITGRAIAPRLFVSIGASGKFNHTVGLRAAETVLAINPDANAPIFDAADAGIVADWRAALPLLVAELRNQLAAAG
jgi:electron transfer flavoprotein alpha subunit